MRKSHGLLLTVLLGFTLTAGAAMDPGQWRKYQTKHVTILSAASDKATRNWAIEFEQIYAALANLLPMIGEKQPPLTVFLFDDKAEFSRHTPLKNGRTADVAGYFIRVADRGYAALNVADNREETRRLIYHEAVHWFFSASHDVRPAWLDEGLAELFSTARIKQDEFSFGTNIPGHILFLQAGAAMNVKQMLQVTRDSADYNEGTRATRFYATAWVFLHYIVCGKDSGGFPTLVKLLGLLNEEMDPAVAFTQAFGRDYARFDQDLFQYATQGRYQVFTRKFDRNAIDRSLRPAPLAADEFNLELAYLLALTNRLEQARPILAGLVAGMPANPRVHEAQGFLAAQAGDHVEARTHFDRALELGSTSYYCYLAPALAELAYRESRGATIATLSPVGARSILDGLNRAILAEPRPEELYNMMSLLLINATPLTPLDGQLIEQGVRLYPRKPDIELGRAIYESRAGQPAEALARFDRIKNSKRGLSHATRESARILALNMRINDATARYRQLMDAQDYAGAIPVVDERIALSPSPHEITRLREHRAELGSMIELKQVEKLLQEENLAAAEPILARLSTEAGSPRFKAQVTKMLEAVRKRLAVQK